MLTDTQQIARARFFDLVLEGVTASRGYDLAVDVADMLLGPDHPAVQGIIDDLHAYWGEIMADPDYVLLEER